MLHFGVLPAQGIILCANVNCGWTIHANEIKILVEVWLALVEGVVLEDLLGSHFVADGLAPRHLELLAGGLAAVDSVRVSVETNMVCPYGLTCRDLALLSNLENRRCSAELSVNRLALPLIGRRVRAQVLPLNLAVLLELVLVDRFLLDLFRVNNLVHVCPVLNVAFLSAPFIIN